MSSCIPKFTIVFQVFLYLISLYYGILAMFGLYKKKQKSKKSSPEKSFALLIAAHNEEIVIAQIIESLKALDYPRQLYDIYVIADNCIDKTAEIARKHNAIVYERHNLNQRGKGYALDWMFKNIFEMEKKYDSVAVFDADNLVSKNFLNEMNNKLKEGYKVVQAFIDSKNPHDSWISECYSIAFWSSNRLFQLSRANLNLSSQIGGTGFCVDTDVLKKIGWGSTCLTEDLEFTCKLIMNGYKVGWVHDACVYDEKPLTLKQSWIQRKRWMQGFADVASRYFNKLMKKAFTEKSIVAFDCAVYTIQPFITLFSGISIILSFMRINFQRNSDIFILSSLSIPILYSLFNMLQFLFIPYVMVIENKLPKPMFGFFMLYSVNLFIFNIFLGESVPLIINIGIKLLYFILFGLVLLLFSGEKAFKIFLWYMLYGLYTLTWMPITIQGIIDKNNKEWNHTKHTRQISIDDIEDADGGTVA